MKADEEIETAISALAQARRAFKGAVKRKLILGNDNHIGDIGEYWVRKFLERDSRFKRYGPKKNAPYDIELSDGTRVSVKTITEWSKTGYGTQVKPLCGKDWTLLADVLLGEDLFPEKIALVPLQELRIREPFVANEGRRSTQKTSAHPRFQWWRWLDEFVVYKHAQPMLGADASDQRTAQA